MRLIFANIRISMNSLKICHLASINSRKVWRPVSATILVTFPSSRASYCLPPSFSSWQDSIQGLAVAITSGVGGVWQALRMPVFGVELAIVILSEWNFIRSLSVCSEEKRPFYTVLVMEWKIAFPPCPNSAISREAGRLQRAGSHLRHWRADSPNDGSALRPGRY